MKIERVPTRAVKVGVITIGGSAPISVQTMTNTPTEDVEATRAQLKELEQAGAELVRVSVPTEAAALALPALVDSVSIPIVADIHFNWKLAIASIEAGVAKIRINPGTIGPKHAVRDIITAARDHGVAIRIGLNAASLPREYRAEGRTKGLLDAARAWVAFFEDLEFFDIVVSAKASSVTETIEVYRALASDLSYPLHVGVTEAGTAFSGSIKSAVALGVLLEEGIGDTIRVSLSADPRLEVRAGIEILKSLGLLEGPELVSCPTCARAEIDVISLAEAVESKLAAIRIPLTVAVMGCAVNGPGEAREADVGLAGSARGILLFKKGVIVRIVSPEEALDALLAEIETIVREKESQTE